MLMKQIYDMSAENVRQFAYEYLRCGVTSRAIQCLERLKWLGQAAAAGILASKYNIFKPMQVRSCDGDY